MRRVRQFGLGITVHTGESGPADEVARVVELLEPDRIGHGVKAAYDPRAMAAISERGIVLEVCPTSNVATGVYPSYEDHPLGALRAAGVRVTLASDDPPYFGATIGGEYDLAAERFGMDEAALHEVTRTAISAGFAEDAVKQRLLERVDRPDDRPST
jgi:adenosine deaminase